MRLIKGDFAPPKGRIGLVAAHFNGLVVENLIVGAREGLLRHGVSADNIDLVRVPGSLEIPLVVRRLAKSGQYAALICLGAVIRGETSHYDVVAGQSASGIAGIALETGLPIINAILTTDNLEQALQRAGGKAGNKGLDAALAAIEMINLLAQLPAGPSA